MRALSPLFTGLALFSVYVMCQDIAVETDHALQPIDRIVLVLAIGCVFAAIHSMLCVTRVAFDEEHLVIRTTFAPWSRFRAPIADVASFAIVTRDGAYRVAAVFRGGSRTILPFELDPLSWSARALLGLAGFRAQIAPRAHAAFLIARLESMLADARRPTPSSPYR